jgi:hypothetical protein
MEFRTITGKERYCVQNLKNRGEMFFNNKRDMYQHVWTLFHSVGCHYGEVRVIDRANRSEFYPNITEARP